MSPEALAAAFYGFIAAVSAVLIAVMVRWLPRRQAVWGSAGLLAWLAYAGAVGASGVLRNAAARPPGILLLALPVAAFAILAIARGTLGARLAAAVPVGVLLALQAFRTGVEATLQGLHEAGQVPRLMTLAGGNVEMLVALAAPLAGWLATRGTAGRRAAWVWNLVGLLSLANVVVRGVLSAPGPLHLLHTEVPNLPIGRMPYSFIPGLMVPLALLLHLLALRALRAPAQA